MADERISTWLPNDGRTASVQVSSGDTCTIVSQGQGVYVGSKYVGGSEQAASIRGGGNFVNTTLSTSEGKVITTNYPPDGSPESRPSNSPRIEKRDGAKLGSIDSSLAGAIAPYNPVNRVRELLDPPAAGSSTIPNSSQSIENVGNAMKTLGITCHNSSGQQTTPVLTPSDVRNLVTSVTGPAR